MNTTEPMPIAEVSAEDREAAQAILDCWFNRSKIEAVMRDHRLTALADAERMLDEARQRLVKARDRMESQAKIAGLSEDQVANIWGVMSGIDIALSLLAAQNGGKG